MFENDELTNELFCLSLYPYFTPKEKCQMLITVFPELNAIFLEQARANKLARFKIEAYTKFKKELNIVANMHRCLKEGIRWTSIFDDSYPEQLRNIFDPPILLYYKGDLSILNKQGIGVVGARACTEYGKNAVRYILPGVIKRGFPIISGLAKGIDSQAHQVTIQLEGKTVGIIGTGLDQYYPNENRMLQDKIAEEHLLLSEFPFGTKPKRHHFPLRNRLIAGLSRGVLVVEAKDRSGSLITAHQALEGGKEVFAVPGSLFSIYSRGCNRLIQVGAKAVLSAEDILEELEY